MSIFLLVSVAEETGLNITLSETPRIGFLAVRPKFCHIYMYVIESSRSSSDKAYIFASWHDYKT